MLSFNYCEAFAFFTFSLHVTQIFTYGLPYVLFYIVDDQLSQHHIPHSPLICEAITTNIQIFHTCVSQFLGSAFCSIDLFIPVSLPHRFRDYICIRNLDIRACMAGVTDWLTLQHPVPRVLGTTAGLHVTASLASRCGHVSEFW